MRSAGLLLVACIVLNSASAQNNLRAYIKDSKSKESIPGATGNVAGTTNGNSANENGLLLLQNISEGKQVILFRATGYETKTDTLIFPINSDTLNIYMDAEDQELEEVTISTTRSNRTIKDIPTRIELINAEELQEKGNMKPGDIRMLLSESTGIQTLQTSATSGNSSIRIEGLDGRYTQILKDGFPLYEGFSGGLGLLQTPPLDLKQVEIVKGSASTLYGGGAIAGLINLISKTPAEKQELRFLVNGTSAGGLDINGYYSKRWKKIGITSFVAYNSNAPYDPAGIGLSAIPKFERFTLNPKLFLYPGKNTDIMLGINASKENRTGGNMKYLEGEGNNTNSYYESNQSKRISSEALIKHRFDDQNELSVKNSLSYFNRNIGMPGYTFDGTQTGSFSEINYVHRRSKLEWIGGVNLFTDAFKEERYTMLHTRDYTLITLGGFIQNTWDISAKLSLESGLRMDHVIDYGTVVLPRASLLYKINNHFTSRLGSGFGYKSPTIFTEESERIQYRNVLPVSPETNKLERSYGGNWDINYKTSLADGAVTISANQLFFYTRLDDPLLLGFNSYAQYQFVNISGHIDAQGTETNMKIAYKHFKLYLGYTFTSSYIHEGSVKEETPLTPRHHTNSVLTYEVENKIKIGLEGYYYGTQRLSDGSTGRDYWLCGLMAEKFWAHFSLFINFENFLDTRQTRFGPIYQGSINNPSFKDIYAPLDGFVVNGGIKVNL